MIIPTVHLNGTSKASLAKALEFAALALNRALEALRETQPNGRDYYPQGDGAIGQAIAEHLERLARVESVRAELIDIWEAICDA